MHKQSPTGTQLHFQLPCGLQERQSFYVAYRAADLYHCYVSISRAQHYAPLNLVRNMRNNLHRTTEVIAPALLAQHLVIDPACGEVVILGHHDAGETFVVPEIEVSLCAVLRHEHFTVLKRTHGSGIYVDIGIQLQQRYLETPCFKHRRHGGCGNALAQR